MGSKTLITPEEVIQLAYTPAEQVAKEHIPLAVITQAQQKFIRPVLNGLYEDLLAGLHPEFCASMLKPALAHYVKYLIMSEHACYDAKSNARFLLIRKETLERASILIDLCVDEAEKANVYTSYDSTKNARKITAIAGGVVINRTKC